MLTTVSKIGVFDNDLARTSESGILSITVDYDAEEVIGSIEIDNVTGATCLKLEIYGGGRNEYTAPKAIHVLSLGAGTNIKIHDMRQPEPTESEWDELAERFYGQHC